MQAKTLANSAFTGAQLRASAPRKASAPVARSRQVTRALSDTNLLISGATAAMLGLGRFIVLPYQRRQVSKAGLPKQNGKTYIEAGDRLAQQASFVGSSNDPAGFTIVDVMAWGALGHVFGYALLAAASNTYNGPFGQ
ncbi:unnamed protein product [Pedinophyceae sp. YPF-701]|nr:unnamed protein product [Pedinophyceae sp. YPF-701]